MAGKDFITQCTLVFKSFEHDVTVIQSKSSLWQFTTISRRTDKKYAVMVAPTFSKVKSLIKVAKKKLPPETRLVVVTSNFTDAENEMSAKEDFTLITLETLNRYGSQMLEARNRTVVAAENADSSATSDKSSFDNIIDNVIDKEKLF